MPSPTVCAKPMHASVIDTPCLSGTPGTRSCRPSSRWLSIITPVMRRSPPAICAGHVVRHRDLALVLLAAVAVRDVDHHLLAQAGGAQRLAARGHVGGVVVRRLAAAQDDVAVVVAARLEDRGHAHLGHAHEGVRRARREDGVGRDLDAAVGAVLEADRAAQARGELAVALALGGARADRAPGDQVGDELRAQQVEELGAGRQAQRASARAAGAARAPGLR